MRQFYQLSHTSHLGNDNIHDNDRVRRVDKLQPRNHEEEFMTLTGTQRRQRYRAQMAFRRRKYGRTSLGRQIYIVFWMAVLRGVYSDTTQLDVELSTRSHSVNNCQLSMNVVIQLTQFVGRDVINKNTTDLAARCSTGSVELS